MLQHILGNTLIWREIFAFRSKKVLIPNGLLDDIWLTAVTTICPLSTFSSLSCPACPLQPVLKSLSCNFVGPRRPFCPQAKQAPPGQGKEGTQASKALFSTMGQYWPSNCTLHCYLVKCKWIGKKNDFFYKSNILFFATTVVISPSNRSFICFYVAMHTLRKRCIFGAIFLYLGKLKKRHTVGIQFLKVKLT